MCNKQGEPCFLGNCLPLGDSFPPWYGSHGDLVLLVKCYLGNLVFFVIVQPTLHLWSTFNVNVDFLSITIMSKGRRRGGGGPELYFVSSRNVCDPEPWDVPSARKCVCFTWELEATSFGNKVYDLELLQPSPSKCRYKVDVSKRFSFHAQTKYGRNSMFLANFNLA